MPTEMPSQPRDTPAEIEEILLEGFRRMGPLEKLQRVWEMNRAVRTLAAARIRGQYGPEISKRELNLRLAALRFDRKTMINVFGWDPEEHSRKDG